MSQEKEENEATKEDVLVPSSSSSGGKNEDGNNSNEIEFVNYENESQLDAVMNLVLQDLSEPYSIFTYRYFLHRFPELCILAINKNTKEPIGCVVGKVDYEDTLLSAAGGGGVGDVGVAANNNGHDDYNHVQQQEEQQNNGNQDDTDKMEIDDGNDNTAAAAAENTTADNTTTGISSSSSLSSPDETQQQQQQQKDQQRLSSSLFDSPNNNNNSHKIPTGYIGMLAVKSSQRRKGIGRKLVKQILERMKTQFKCQSVTLETEVSNLTALKLYQNQFGFIREELLVRYYLNWGDAYRLRLWF